MKMTTFETVTIFVLVEHKFITYLLQVYDNN